MAMVVVKYAHYNGCSQKEFEILIFDGILYDEIVADITPDEDIQKALDYLFGIARKVKGRGHEIIFYIPNRKGIAREISNTLRKILL